MGSRWLHMSNATSGSRFEAFILLMQDRAPGWEEGADADSSPVVPFSTKEHTHTHRRKDVKLRILCREATAQEGTANNEPGRLSSPLHGAFLQCSRSQLEVVRQ